MNLRKYKPNELDQKNIEDIWNFIKLFVERKYDEFLETLNACQFITLLRDHKTDKLQGIFAYSIIEAFYNRKKVRSLFVQWGMMHPDSRNTIHIQLLIIKHFLRLKAKDPFTPLFYTFVASTYKSYLMLHNSIEIYWPKLNIETPQKIKNIQDVLMKKQIGDYWDSERRLELGKNQLLYKEGVIHDNHIYRGRHRRVLEFYNTLNKTQQQGDGIGCICPLTFENIGSSVHKLLKKHKYRLGKVIKRNKVHK